MGISGIGIWQSLIILVIVMLLFGSRRLGSLGGDLGQAVSGFRKAVRDTEGADSASDAAPERLAPQSAPDREADGTHRVRS